MSEDDDRPKAPAAGRYPSSLKALKPYPAALFWWKELLGGDPSAEKSLREALAEGNVGVEMLMPKAERSQYDNLPGLRAEMEQRIAAAFRTANIFQAAERHFS